ncbi:MAG: allantoinase PuuE, partial [Pseudomonadota bacterium]
MTSDTPRYQRDMLGYGPRTPDAVWPNGAKIAVQFVLNYEEGGENNILHGDPFSEAFLSEIFGATNWPNQRHMNIESLFEYGSRSGFWRIYRMMVKKQIPVTVFGVTTAMARSPTQVAAMLDADWEIASHGLKWIDYRNIPLNEEREHMQEAIVLHEMITGAKPTGWYTGRTSHNTVNLAAETELFRYISDVYCDDIPYWHTHNGHNQLLIPYTLDVNDMRFLSPIGISNVEEFYTYLKESFDTLYAEGKAGAPKMMSIGLHCRIIGRAGRIRGLEKFIDYIKTKKDVWIAKRIDIAEHWHNTHPKVEKLQPSTMSKSEFVAIFGSIYENSPWIANRAFEFELGPAHDCAEGMHNVLVRVFRSASDEERMNLLRAHPDLAGKLARARRLTKDSTIEQAHVGLDDLTDEERELFDRLNK